MKLFPKRFLVGSAIGRLPLRILNRARFLGHSVELRGHGHGRKLVLAASCAWAEVAVFLDQSLGVVAGEVGPDRRQQGGVRNRTLRPAAAGRPRGGQALRRLPGRVEQ